jgi:hypothetical protein
MAAGDVVDDLRADDSGRAVGLSARTQAAATGALIDDIAEFVHLYVVFSKPQAVVVPLWTAHTWVIDALETTPYLWLRSAVKQSGKTRTLEVLELLVHTPWLTARTTPAALVRKIHQETPTLLLDETDAAFNSGDEYSETLRGVLNSGHRRGGQVSVCVGQGGAITVQDFSTFCPKALAGLSVLPDTVADRSIPIMLKRRNKLTEPVERFRRRDAVALAAPLRDRLATWAETVTPLLAEARPEVPAALNDRAGEGWEGLLAIAELAGPEWSRAAREAAVTLHGDAMAQEETTGVLLLQATRETYRVRGVGRISTTALLQALVDRDDEPWSELWGRQVAAGDTKGPGFRLARFLKPFGVTPRTLRFDDGSRFKGYLAEDFEDAWSRYLPPAGPNDASQ